MTDYISRDAAVNGIAKIIIESDMPEDWNKGMSAAVSALFRIPAADVRPVARGKWITGNDNPRTYGRIRAMCGRCGAFALAEMVNAGSYKEHLSNFCPNCGARMDKDGDGDV